MVMYKRIALFVLAAIIATTSLIAMIGENAFAAPELSEPYFPAALVERAKKKSAANVYIYCVHKNSSPAPSSAASSPGSSPGNQVVFNKNIGVAKDDILGHGWGGSASGGASDFNSKGDNNQNCGSLSITTFVNFFNSIGFNGSDPQQILCNMASNVVIYSTSESKSEKEQCDKDKAMEGTTITVKLEAFEALIRIKVEDFDNVDRFYTAYTLVKRYCNVTNQGTDVTKIKETNYPIFFADKTGEGNTYRHTTDKANDSFYTWNDMTNYTQGTAHCNTMMNNYIGYQNHTPKQPWVDDYVAYLKKIHAAEEKAKTATAEKAKATETKEYAEACKSLGYTSGKELEACAEGFRHLSDESFCATKYQGSPGELAACQAAQGSTKKAPPPEEKEEDQENCKIDYIGWFICPIVNTLASMSEGARAQLINMLTVDAKSILGDTSDGSVYSYWSKIRDYANILFVVFFLFVIYSQMTGYGLDNYGIKRMLPKLIVGVIVVNASFYICGLLVDLSNVVGSSAFNFVSTAAVGDIPAGDWSNSDSGWINKIAAGALILTVGYFALAAVISMLLFVVITAVTTIFLLGVREAIIIMCIVLSPLAFVAMIMPNTEGLYKKWWSAFKAALMVYPMVGLVFGASNLAARILGSGLDEKDIIMQSIVALLVFAPLLIVPKLVRNAVEIIGIGGAIAWANKKMNKGRDRLTDKVGKWRENKLTSQFGKHRREKAQLRNAQIRGGTYRGKGGIANFRNWRSAANRRLNAKSGDFGQKRKLAGSAAALAEDNERMKAANAWIADNNMSSDRLAEIATGFTRNAKGDIVPVDLKGISSYQRRAAMQALAPHMTSKQASDLAEASASFGDASLQKEAANAIAESGAKKAPWLGGKQLEAIRQGTYNEEEAMGDYIKNKASGSGLANADADAVRRMVKFSADQVSQNADSSYMRSLIRARADLEADPKTAGGVPSAVRQEIERIPPMQRQSNSGGGRNQGGGGGGRNQGGGGGQGGSGGGGQGGGGDQGGGQGDGQDGGNQSGSGGGTTTHNGQTFTQTSSGLYIPKH